LQLFPEVQVVKAYEGIERGSTKKKKKKMVPFGTSGIEMARKLG
jgi:hypothetical protein